VEPGCQAHQMWDLEAFLLTGSTLTLVGGFDFENGIAQDSSRNDLIREDVWDAGDIFVDIDGDAVFGSAIDMSQYNVVDRFVNATFGYDYVLDIDWEGDTVTYDVLSLGDSSLLTVYFDQNEGANPWRIARGGTLVEGYQDLELIDYYSTSDSSVEGITLEGGNAVYPHYVAKFDLGFIDFENLDEMYVHTTVECGNDSLMGHEDDFNVPDGGATIALLGMALVGLAALARRR